MKITFWGVRGSIACPGPSYTRVGGNTSAVELAVGGETLIFDAGTGLRGLGASMMQKSIKRSHILLSHTHWDHTCGLPFFAPIYDAESSIQIIAGHARSFPGGVCGVLRSQLASPSFPVSFEQMAASTSFVDVSPGTKFEVGGAEIRSARLSHPDGATGYRVQHAGVSVAYVTDTEHDPERLDARILGLIEGADLVIYDSTYTDDEFAAHRGWGHSTWQEGVRLCRAAGAKRLAIFHHDPDHDDAFMAQVGRDAKRMWEGAFVAREGMSVDLTPSKPTKKPRAHRSDSGPLRRYGDDEPG